jgi:hypothetical protein
MDYLCFLIKNICELGSSDGIASNYGLDGPGSNPGGGRDFPPIQTVPGAHPDSYTMGTGSFPGLEAAEAWGLNPPTTHLVSRS